MLTDPVVQYNLRSKPYRVAPGKPPARSVQPLLHEVRCALLHLSELGEATVIDLRNVSQSSVSTTGVTERY